MRIIEVSKIESGGFAVKIKRSLIASIFKDRTYIIKVKDTGSDYVVGGGAVYIKQDGTKINNHSPIMIAVDKFRRSW